MLDGLNVFRWGILLHIFIMAQSIPDFKSGTKDYYQYMKNTPKFEQVWEAETAKLEDQIKSHEDIIETHFPLHWQIDKDVYRYIYILICICLD